MEREEVARGGVEKYIDMIKNYFKSAVRNFLKHKSFTLLNVIGLPLAR